MDRHSMYLVWEEQEMNGNGKELGIELILLCGSYKSHHHRTIWALKLVTPLIFFLNPRTLKVYA